MEIFIGILVVVIFILGWLLLEIKKDEGSKTKEVEVLLNEKNIIAENKKKTWANQDVINKSSADELNKLRRTWKRNS